MQLSANGDLPQPPPATTPAWPSDPKIEPNEPRNLLLLVAHQIVFRIGWVFKTESVIMPAFADWLDGTGLVRGCLPTLNRLGQSIPPIFAANLIRSTKRKKWILVAIALLTVVPFAGLSLVCLAGDARQQTWTVVFFLLLYFLFFCLYGLYLVSFGTVQGKLIRPTLRGRLLLLSTFFGAFPAMGFALWLLPGWLEQTQDGDSRGWGLIFGFTAACFFLSGLVVVLLREPADHAPPRRPRPFRAMAETWGALRSDRNLRRLVLVVMLFGGGLIIFPHYQALARERLGKEAGLALMVWVVAQNLAVGLYSLGVGPLADALGNRLTLRVLIIGSAIAPALAIFFSNLGPLGGDLYWIVFIWLGITPLVLRILINYTLEICEPDQHPRYLSTVSLCLAIPFLFSPVVGWMTERVGFDLVFWTSAGLVLLSGLMTFRLEEPRHHLTDEEAVDTLTTGQE